MTSYTTDNLIDTQLSFISRIIMLSGVVGGLSACILMIVFLLGGNQATTSDYIETRASIQSESVTHPAPVISPGHLTGDDLKEMLHENNLWDIAANDVIAPLVISSFPENLDSLNIDDKKKIFLHTLLPIALTANDEIDNERLRLFDILASSGALPGNFKLNTIPVGWDAILSSEDKAWLTSLEDKYNAHDIKELKKRMRRVPVSLVMAQGALESSWGTSRFTREGNNLFGLRTWGKEGLSPKDKQTESTYLVASYDSLLDSVHAYLLTLNSHRLYSKFREIRLSTQDPILLSKGLIYYSEKRKEYVSQVNRIIKYNSLKKFDTVQLKQGQPINHLITLSKK